MAGPGRRGPAPKPTELKRRLGNPGKRRLPSENVVALAPAVADEAPPALSGMELRRRLMVSPAAAWIAETDLLTTLELACQAWDEREAIRAEMTLTHDPVLRRGLRADLRALEKQLTTWLSLLGLSPTDRSRLGVAEVKARSKLEELQDRRDRRLARSRAG